MRWLKQISIEMEITEHYPISDNLILFHRAYQQRLEFPERIQPNFINLISPLTGISIIK